jgi:hypothetical protein
LKTSDLQGEFVVPLNCCLDGRSDSEEFYLGPNTTPLNVPVIFLCQGKDSTYYRIRCNELRSVDWDRVELHCLKLEDDILSKGLKIGPRRGSIYVRDNNAAAHRTLRLPHETDGFIVNAASLLEHEFRRTGSHPRSLAWIKNQPWDFRKTPKLVLVKNWVPMEESYPELHFTNSFTGELVVLVLGIAQNQNPWIILLTIPNCPDVSTSLVSDLISPVSFRNNLPTLRPRSNSLDVIACSASDESLEHDYEYLSPGIVGVDRISRPLQGGTMTISASLKRVRVDNKATFAVNVEIDPNGFMRWPPPSRILVLEKTVRRHISERWKTELREPQLVGDQVTTAIPKE